MAPHGKSLVIDTRCNNKFDLERNERAVSSSLADIEAKYSRALEEKILLEHELLDKANLEEECQRLKDDLRGESSHVSSC